MSTDSNQQGHFEPIHDAHAIEQVVFALQIDRPLDDEKFIQARKKIAENYKDKLPGRAELQGFRVAIGALGPVAPIPSGPAMGTVFSRTNPDGTIESELRIERNAVTFRTLLYTRWATVWSQAREYFDAVTPEYLENAKISGISLNYIDKFVWKGKPADSRPTLLLRKGSNYLCPHVYDATDLWHSHTGAFLRPDDQTKRLVNINVDHIDENGPDGLRRVLVITTVLTDLMNQPEYKPLEVTGKDSATVFDAHIHQLHDFGKMTFGNVINDDMCKRIALTD